MRDAKPSRLALDRFLAKELLLDLLREQTDAWRLAPDVEVST